MVVCREISKFYEEYYRYKVSQLNFFEKTLKGEITIVISEKKYNKNIIQFVKKYYRYAVTTKRSRFRFNKFDLLEIPRIPVNSDTSIFKFYLKIKTFYEDIKYIN